MKSVSLFRPAALILSLACTATDAMADGHILTTPTGMTLYTFDKDSAGTSNCYDDCAAKWPPYTATADEAAAEGFDRIARKDGSLQWSYQGKPLYTWVGDSKPGDTSGDGVKGVWHVAH